MAVRGVVAGAPRFSGRLQSIRREREAAGRATRRVRARRAGVVAARLPHFYPEEASAAEDAGVLAFVRLVRARSAGEARGLAIGGIVRARSARVAADVSSRP